MRATLVLLLPVLLLAACRDATPEKTEAATVTGEGETTGGPSGSGESAAPGVATGKEASSKAGVPAIWEDETKPDASPEELFRPRTVKAIDHFFEQNPDATSITKLIGNKQFQELRKAHLPDWEFPEDLKSELNRSLKTIAAAQGVDPEMVGHKDPNVSAHVQMEIPADDGSLQRVVGHVIERDGDGFDNELMNILVKATDASVENPADAPISVTPKLP